MIPVAAWPGATVHTSDLITLAIDGPPRWYQVERIDPGPPATWWCRPVHLDLPAPNHY